MIIFGALCNYLVPEKEDFGFEKKSFLLFVILTELIHLEQQLEQCSVSYTLNHCLVD